MSVEVNIPILQAGQTAAELATLNPIGFERQLVFETDTLKAKLLDGVTPFNSLPYLFQVGSVDWGDIGGNISDQTDLQSALGGKQATLVSGTNIKTINGNSILGSGDLTISTSVNWGAIGGTLSDQTDLQNALNAKLDVSTAASTYLTIANAASTYLTIANAASTYLTQVNAASTYATIASLSNYLTTAAAASTYVPYTGATSALDLGANNLTVDTNVLFVDATNNRVGIGTVTPNAPLDVSSGNITQGGADSNYNLNLYGSTYAYLGLNTSGTGKDSTRGFQFGLEDTGIYAGANLILRENKNMIFWTNNTVRATLTDGGLFAIGDTVTSTSPALKRASTDIQIRLADDSGYANLDAALYKVGGTSGFTGTGAYTNFIIVGGIITNAS